MCYEINSELPPILLVFRDTCIVIVIKLHIKVLIVESIKFYCLVDEYLVHKSFKKKDFLVKILFMLKKKIVGRKLC